jgi:hypothetical protein
MKNIFHARPFRWLLWFTGLVLADLIATNAVMGNGLGYEYVKYERGEAFFHTLLTPGALILLAALIAQEIREKAP